MTDLSSKRVRTILARPSFSISVISLSDMLNSSTPFLALNKSFVHATISSPYITSSMMPVVNAVCHEKREESTCFHTGIPFLPDFCSSSYSFRARASSSVKTGRLLLMAIKNI